VHDAQNGLSVGASVDVGGGMNLVGGGSVNGGGASEGGSVRKGASIGTVACIRTFVSGIGTVLIIPRKRNRTRNMSFVLLSLDTETRKW